MNITRHALTKAQEFGLSEEDVREIVRRGIKYPSTMKPYQNRHVMRGYAVIVDTSTDTIVTLYQDRILTPLRPDQIIAGVKIERKV